MILDIGPKSIVAVEEAARRAKTLVWNGPFGAFETPPFDAATMQIAKIAALLTDARASSSRSPAAATRSRRSTRPASPNNSPMSRRRAAPSSNGWKARRCPASKRSARSNVSRKEEHMSRITLRQLLDHAAEHGYGVPAFNINNMEQALAIGEAASALEAPVIIQASRGARSYANDIMLRHMMDALTEMYPQIPICVHLDHGNGPATCVTAMQAELHLGDDGRLAQVRRQDAGRLGLQRRRHQAGRRHGPSRRRFGRGRTRRARLARDRHGRQGRRPRRRGQAQPRPVAHQPRRGGQVRARDQGRRARHRHGHLARRLQVLAQARPATSSR